MGVARLQLQEAQHQRAGETQQRGRERRAHAAQRRGEAVLQLVEHGDAVGRLGVERADGLAHRLDGIEQAPEGAEQAEEHQQAHQIAAGVARLVEPGADRIHDRAHGRGRQRQRARAVAQHGRHGRQQDGAVRDGQARIGDAEGVDPADLGIKPQHLLEAVQDARQQHEADQDVEPRVVEHRVPELAVEDGDQQPDQHQEHEHAPQVQPGRRQAPVQGGWRPVRRSRSCHESFSASIWATLAKDARTTNRQLNAVSAFDGAVFGLGGVSPPWGPAQVPARGGHRPIRPTAPYAPPGCRRRCSRSRTWRARRPHR